LEALESRTVLSSTTVLGVTVDNVPTADDLGLPPLVAVPVSADVQASGALARLFGADPSLAMDIPVPAFLTPSGTSTVTTRWTGPVTFTNFQVDSARLNQLADNLALPDGSTPYVSPLLRAVTLQTAPTLDVVHFVTEPLALDLLGVQVGLSGVDMTMSFPDVPGSTFFTGTTGAAPISTVSRGLDLFAAGLGIAQQKVNEVAGRVALPAPLATAVQRLTPANAGTVSVAQYQVAPTQVDGQTLTVDVAGGATVEVSAATGPDRLLGDLLAAAVSIENAGPPDLGALHDELLADLLARSPLQLLEDILAAIPLGSLIPNPFAAYQALGALTVEPFASEVLATVVNQPSGSITGGGGLGPLGGVLSLSGRNSFTALGGLAGSSSGPGGGDRIQLKKDADADPPTDEVATEWDESPLPEVLPDLGFPDSGALPWPDAGGGSVEAASRAGGERPAESLTRAFGRQLLLLNAALAAAEPPDALPGPGGPVGDSGPETDPDPDRVAADDVWALLAPDATTESPGPQEGAGTGPPVALSALTTLALLAVCQRRLREEIDVLDPPALGTAPPGRP
jgi:hypothetical protein